MSHDIFLPSFGAEEVDSFWIYARI